MKKLILLFTILIMCISLMAQPPKGPAKKGMIFGINTTAEGAVAANELTKVMAEKTTADVKVKGIVTEVCKAEVDAPVGSGKLAALIG